MIRLIEPVGCSFGTRRQNNQTKKMELQIEDSGVLIGFGEEASDGSSCIVGIVALPDGTFQTPTLWCIKLDEPIVLTTMLPTNEQPNENNNAS